MKINVVINKYSVGWVVHCQIAILSQVSLLLNLLVLILTFLDAIACRVHVIICLKLISFEDFEVFKV